MADEAGSAMPNPWASSATATVARSCPECGAINPAFLTGEDGSERCSVCRSVVSGPSSGDGTYGGGNAVQPGYLDGTGTVSSKEPMTTRGHKNRRKRTWPELRVVGETSGGVEVAGLAIPYNRRTVIHDQFGSFGETVARGAAAAVPRQDVRLLYGHDGNANLVFARTKSGTLRLTEHQDGLRFNATLDVQNNSQAADLCSAIDRGDLDGVSWSFTVAQNGDQWNDAMTERTISRFGDVREISVVWLPAYANDTSVAIARSADATRADIRRLRARRQQISIRTHRFKESTR